MKQAGIYKIERTGAGECYVGSSVDIDRRWAKHQQSLALGDHHASRLQRSWKKYGQAAFCFSVLELTEPDRDTLQQREQHWMAQLAPCFNTLPAAYSAAGYKHTDDAKRRIGAAGVGRKRTAQAVEKVAASRRGQSHTEEARAKISAAHLGRKQTPESIEARAVALRGRGLSAEHRAKIGAANRGKVRTPEQRAAVGAAQLGRKARPESVALMAASRRGIPRSQKTKDRIRATMLANWEARNAAA